MQSTVRVTIQSYPVVVPMVCMNPKIVIAKFGDRSCGFSKEVTETALLAPRAIVNNATHPYILLPETINPIEQQAGIK